jgi:hypothetical protein
LKLTRDQLRNHKKALEILSQDKLSLDDKIIVYNYWHEGADNNSAALGAFFTPYDMACDVSIDIGGKKILDMCAGIGVLSFCYYHFRNVYEIEKPEITCVELNPQYVEIGKKLLPEANWICGDIFDVWQDLPKDFDNIVSNPPFGNKFGKENKSPKYTGGEFEYKIMDIASHMGRWGTFILPQSSAGFKYSGAQYYDRVNNSKYDRFFKDTGLETNAGCGIDTSLYRDSWKSTNILTEIVCMEFKND